MRWVFGRLGRFEDKVRVVGVEHRRQCQHQKLICERARPTTSSFSLSGPPPSILFLSLSLFPTPPAKTNPCVFRPPIGWCRRLVSDVAPNHSSSCTPLPRRRRLAENSIISVGITGCPRMTRRPGHSSTRVPQGFVRGIYHALPSSQGATRAS